MGEGNIEEGRREEGLVVEGEGRRGSDTVGWVCGKQKDLLC